MEQLLIKLDKIRLIALKAEAARVAAEQEELTDYLDLSWTLRDLLEEIAATARPPKFLANDLGHPKFAEKGAESWVGHYLEGGEFLVG